VNQAQTNGFFKEKDNLASGQHFKASGVGIQMKIQEIDANKLKY
jgi:hypothetical protein